MSHRHLNTLSGSGAEVYRMMCEAIKAAQKWDEMSWNNSDHTAQTPPKKRKTREKRLACVNRPLRVLLIHSSSWLAVNENASVPGNTALPRLTVLWRVGSMETLYGSALGFEIKYKVDVEALYCVRNTHRVTVHYKVQTTMFLIWS